MNKTSLYEYIDKRLRKQRREVCCDLDNKADLVNGVVPLDQLPPAFGTITFHDNFNALNVALPQPVAVDTIAAVRNSQGTSWLPGPLGGTYYPKGYYRSTGAVWEFFGEFSYQATQPTVDAGLNNDQFVTPFTLANASQWDTKNDAIQFQDEGINLGTSGTVTEVDFTGDITASRAANKVTVNVNSAAGPQGPQGDPGAQGFQGAQGDAGATGSQGPQGFQGSQGAQGFQGTQGNAGSQGPQGFQGVQGNQGFQGFQGNQGNQGIAGTGSYLLTGFTNQTSVNVVHAFGTYPSVQVMDDTEAVIIPLSILHNTVNDYTVSFSISTSGNVITTLGSPQYNAYVEKTSAYGLTTADYTVNCTSGTFAATLPTSVGITGKLFNIKNSGAGVITINTTGGQTVDGQASGFWTLSTGDNITVQSTGANWIIL